MLSRSKCYYENDSIIVYCTCLTHSYLIKISNSIKIKDKFLSYRHTKSMQALYIPLHR